MKNGKLPTLRQKKILKSHGLNPNAWLVVKDLPETMEVVSRATLKKISGKKRTRVLSKDI